MLIKSPCPERVHKKVVRLSFFLTADFYDLPKSEFGKKERKWKDDPSVSFAQFSAGRKGKPKNSNRKWGEKE